MRRQVSNEELQALARQWTAAAIAYAEGAAPLPDGLEYVPHPYLIGVAAVKCSVCERINVHPAHMPGDEFCCDVKPVTS